MFRPLNPPEVSFYSCGPTVYDSAHVGNFRAFLTYDVLKRVLQYLGYNVRHVCNLTDIDDKIINRANERKLKDIQQLTREFETKFFEDLDALNIVRATHYPRATDHVTEMMDMIRDLSIKGLAYETPDGSWYFRTQSQEGYGRQLVNLDYNQMQLQADDVESDKEHMADFCLWKAFKPGVDRMDAAWSSDLHGIKLGRPGWHLECSAMAIKYFKGETLDLHGGGIDLQFPHHENEIAQSQGVTGRTFCNCWIHNGFVNLDNEKMSKSLGNFLTLRTACPTPDDVRAYRYLVVSSQYRNPLSFTQQAMQASKNAVKRMDKVKQQLDDALQNFPGDSTNVKGDNELARQADSALAQFNAAIRDDLSMPRAAASLFALIKTAEAEFKSSSTTNGDAPLDLAGLYQIRKAMNQMDLVFGIFYEVPLSEEEVRKLEESSSTSIPEQVLELVSQRTAAKEAQDWELADSLRARISELGFAVKDVKGGEPIVSRVD